MTNQGPDTVVLPDRGLGRTGTTRSADGLPRLPSRGPIEAASASSTPPRARRLLRLPSRGPIEAPRPRSQRATRRGVFHGYPAVAALKPGHPGDRGRHRHVFHGYPAVAPLKVARPRPSRAPPSPVPRRGAGPGLARWPSPRAAGLRAWLDYRLAGQPWSVRCHGRRPIGGRTR